MSEKRMTITRKITLYPYISEENIIEKHGLIKPEIEINNKGKETKEFTKFKNDLSKYKKEEVDRVYKYLRDGMEAQNKAANQYMSALFATKTMEISSEDRKELDRLYSRVSDSDKGSAYDINEIQFAKGLPTTASMPQKVRQDFSKSCKDGLMYGRVSLPTYKADNPLLVHVDYLRLMRINKRKNGFYHNYETHMDFLDHLYKKDLEIFIKFANDITFKVVFGTNVKRTMELRSVIKNIFEENYLVQGSSIGIDNGKIILNLSMSIPVQELELNEDTAVGVDLGLAIPAVCALNNNDYIKKSIGSADDFVRERTIRQHQRRQLSRNLARTSGGHGRKKKMSKLETLRDRERNFVKTYNHYVSKQVVDFAVKNKAKYINIECLKGYDSSKYILRNWSFYELQQYITYKAQKYGIEVRKVNPCYTSQICSCCGVRGIRPKQSRFQCVNPECEVFKEQKEKDKYMNADYNGARNIAKSTLFLDKEVTNKEKEKARKYYGIAKEEIEDDCL